LLPEELHSFFLEGNPKVRVLEKLQFMNLQKMVKLGRLLVLEDISLILTFLKVLEKGIAASLRTLVDKNPFLIVATDFDREGELIGVEVVDLLKEYNKNIDQIKRAKFSAITNYEIKTAFDKLVEVDYNLSSAGESRQVIDLIWGAVLTRFISLTSQRYGKKD
jgi:DNA topoisomerase-1